MTGPQYPPPYYPPQPPRKRRVWPWILLGVAVLVFGGCGAIVLSAGHSVDQAVKAAGNGGPTPAAAPAATIGAPVRDGKFEFTVTGLSTAGSVGPADFGKTAQGKYQILQLTIRNIGNQSQTLNDSSQAVYDATGRKFDASTEADIYLGTNDQNVLLEQINPGNSVTGQIAFDMPVDDVPVKVVLHDSMFSGGVTVTLQ